MSMVVVLIFSFLKPASSRWGIWVSWKSLTDRSGQCEAAGGIMKPLSCCVTPFTINLWFITVQKTQETPDDGGKVHVITFKLISVFEGHYWYLDPSYVIITQGCFRVLWLNLRTQVLKRHMHCFHPDHSLVCCSSSEFCEKLMTSCWWQCPYLNNDNGGRTFWDIVHVCP